MKRLPIGLPGVLALALVLAACANSTALRFTNASDCGPAAVSLTNSRTGNISDLTVAPGKTVRVDLEPEVAYHYVVTYERQAGDLRCEDKSVTTRLRKGQTLNVRLESTLDPTLAAQTAVPNPTPAP